MTREFLVGWCTHEGVKGKTLDPKPQTLVFIREAS